MLSSPLKTTMPNFKDRDPAHLKRLISDLDDFHRSLFNMESRRWLDEKCSETTSFLDSKTPVTHSLQETYWALGFRAATAYAKILSEEMRKKALDSLRRLESKDN